ncbi:MAG: hypothetical protein JOY72_09600 [Actinobacteria bacterium]|nr:hypothetical protein [Actinomycetota bacterium]MBV8480545.1 hypothetical protein [Actinomycetota bacterium]MBV8599883.1 hypothetical protein [Actinomycetota bacterium]
MGDQEQSHREEMNAAIRAQRERQAPVRVPAAPEPVKRTRTARILARLRRK